MNTLYKYNFVDCATLPVTLLSLLSPAAAVLAIIQSRAALAYVIGKGLNKVIGGKLESHVRMSQAMDIGL